jgi:transcriptional regulator with XRE-family HTH domain
MNPGFESMPSSSANAVLPPALSISRVVSSGVMERESTRRVYSASNETFTSRLHSAFTLPAMTDEVIDRALKIAKDRHGWNQPEFAQRIGAEKQHITNWKARGMPPARYAKVANVLGITVDELLGNKPAKQTTSANRISEPTVVAYDVKLTESAVMFAAEWAKLPPALQAQVQSLVHSMVAELVRDGRQKPGKQGTSERTPVSHG